jgi:hypothetical protein
MYLRLRGREEKRGLLLGMMAVVVVVLSCAGVGGGHRKNVLRKDTERGKSETERSC